MDVWSDDAARSNSALGREFWKCRRPEVQAGVQSIATLLLVVGIVSGELVSVTRNQFGFIARELKTLVAALQQAAEKAG